MKSLYKWGTKIGTFFICQSIDGRFHPVFDGEKSLGSYSEPWQAAEDLAGGHTFSVSSGIDTSTLGIPEHHLDWHSINQ